MVRPFSARMRSLSGAFGSKFGTRSLRRMICTTGRSSGFAIESSRWPFAARAGLHRRRGQREIGAAGDDRVGRARTGDHQRLHAQAVLGEETAVLAEIGGRKRERDVGIGEGDVLGLLRRYDNRRQDAGKDECVQRASHGLFSEIVSGGDLGRWRTGSQGGRSHAHFRHGRACPGHPRLDNSMSEKGVDARGQRGHDAGQGCRCHPRF